jgi:phosphate-selective porin OprO/OprP
MRRIADSSLLPLGLTMLLCWHIGSVTAQPPAAGSAYDQVSLYRSPEPAPPLAVATPSRAPPVGLAVSRSAGMSAPLPASANPHSVPGPMAAGSRALSRTLAPLRRTDTMTLGLAQSFAEFADNQFLRPVPPSAHLVAYQPSLSENGGQEALDSLNRRVEALERQNQETGQREKREPASGLEQHHGFEHNFFGRIQSDSVSIGQSPANIAQVGHAPNGVDFRRVRIGMQGTGYEIYFYRLEVDFVEPDKVTNRRPRLTDAYAEIRQLGYLGTLRMGEFRVPLSTERLMSANDTTFIERGLPQAFNPSRQLGLMLFNSTPNYLASYYTGISTFHATNEAEQFGKAGRFDFTQRFVFLPWYDEPSDGRYLLHFGGAYLYENARNATISYQTAPEAVLTYDNQHNLIPSFIQTGDIVARNSQIAQVEASTVLGPLSFQGEFYANWVDPTAGSTPYYFHGAYVFVSYFLTGEHRLWNRDQGYYTSVTPFTNFFRLRGSDRSIMQGPGAWELAARFSTMDLSDKSIQGGRLNDITLGVNWYLNRQMRIMANYIYAMNNVDNMPSYADIFLTRAQIVW